MAKAPNCVKNYDQNRPNRFSPMGKVYLGYLIWINKKIVRRHICFPPSYSTPAFSTPFVNAHFPHHCTESPCPADKALRSKLFKQHSCETGSYCGRSNSRQTLGLYIVVCVIFFCDVPSVNPSNFSIFLLDFFRVVLLCLLLVGFFI